MNDKRIYLSDIVDKKRERLNQNKVDLGKLKELANLAPPQPSFIQALSKDGLSVIGEVKKASPSKGLIKKDFDPLKIAKEYNNVVDAISVLTEEDFFCGKDEYLYDISQNVTIPTLCKDFIISEQQIYNAKILGASGILLIVAILTDDELYNYYSLAKSIGLDPLVETHTKQEIKRALDCDIDIIGINNRDLATFKTDVITTIELRQYIGDDKIVISESGIMGAKEIIMLKSTRINGVLIGESFMRAGNISSHLKELKDAYKD